MVCVVHTFNVIDGSDWDHAVAACKQMFDYEKRVFGQQMTFMHAITGDTRRVMTIGFFESKKAHDDYAKRERKTQRSRSCSRRPRRQRSGR